MSHSKISELQKKAYDRFDEVGSTDYIRIHRIRELISLVCSKGGKKMLDIGCGDGIITAQFTKNNECWGVDIGENVVRKARERGLKAFVQDIDEDNLFFEDEYFDIIVCSETLEHVFYTDHVLAEINRVIRKQGLLVISFPNVNQPISWVMQIFFDYPPMHSARYKSTHVRDFSLRIMRAALSVNGFKILRVEGSHIFPFRNKLSRYLAKKIPRLGEKVLIVAEKISEPKIAFPVVWDVRKL